MSLIRTISGVILMFLSILGSASAQTMPDKLTLLNGDTFETSAWDGKVVLYVNVASRCGFTPQYDGLQELWTEMKDDGLVIVGVPCNQFGSQEPGNGDQIQSFCRINYGVDFPLLEKQDVNGKDPEPALRVPARQLQDACRMELREGLGRARREGHRPVPLGDRTGQRQAEGSD